MIESAVGGGFGVRRALIHKGIPFSATLYGFYTIMAVLGYRKWLRLMEAQK
ncbi:MAG: hypothetical protein Q4G12_06905 [Bacteroidales bacterium]|nr:hypothetical protein [Bacteroidales bacterium]